MRGSRTTSGTEVVVAGARHELRLVAPLPTGTVPWGCKVRSSYRRSGLQRWCGMPAKDADEGGWDGAGDCVLQRWCRMPAGDAPEGGEGPSRRPGLHRWCGMPAGDACECGWVAPVTMCFSAGAGCRPGTHARVGRGGAVDCLLQRWCGKTVRGRWRGLEGAVPVTFGCRAGAGRRAGTHAVPTAKDVGHGSGDMPMAYRRAMHSGSFDQK
jgi:hypothetical protein